MATAVLLISLGVARLVASFLSVRWPIVAVGERVIDGSPKPVKEWAIRNLGTSDKPALQFGIIVLLAIFTLLMARLALRNVTWGMAGIALFGLIGVLSTKQSVDGVGGYFPPLLGAVAGSMAISWLVRRHQLIGRRTGPAINRRSFLAAAAAISAGGATAGAVGLAMDSGRTGNLAKDAAKLKLPSPGPNAAPPIPASASIGHGASPFITPSSQFYRVDTALVPPSVDLDSWRLKIHGMVDTPIELDFTQLINRGVIERVITLCCVSNEVGGAYVGNTKWLGVPLAPLLHEAGVQSGATQIAMESADGFTAGFPTEVALDGRDAMIAVGMERKPLPIAHGFPARMLIPGLYGYVSATKWLTDIRLTTLEDFDGYWVDEGWAKLGPIKTQSRIDVPRDGASLSPGTVAIAGVAFAQHKGIAKVEVKIDDHGWQQATLATNVTNDAWRQWYYAWDAKRGSHTIAVRATDNTGYTQTSRLADPAPSGATGWHTIEVDVG
jgi:DMSO/TMAO reductase YedYZ molybdopterin-dependent catalytic subunit